ncbi:Dedicator of cytokinesis protein 3 [Tyrophagus putrescentiae]|nr:Dedicator of cytokinesis protein 3 [Tyrophagus putrescentiae]
MESSTVPPHTTSHHFYHQILSNHPQQSSSSNSSSSPSKSSRLVAPESKMILEANSNASLLLCNVQLSSSADEISSSSPFSAISMHLQSQSSSSPQSPPPAPPAEKWTALPHPLMAIAVANLRPSRPSSSGTIKSRSSSVLSASSSSTSSSSTSWTAQSLDLAVGDVLVVVEHLSSGNYGIFPASYVWMENQTSSSSSLTTYYTALLDPLYLQVVRTLREWHQHLLAFYRANAHPERYQAVRKLMAELIEIARGPLGRELSPTLWRRRTNAILKVLLYQDEEELQGMNSSSNTTESATEAVTSPSKSSSVLEPSLEELYDRVLSKLNQGNQLLGLEVMPSFTHGTFASDTVAAASFAGLTRRKHSQQMFLDAKRIKEGSGSVKFSPYFARENSKYLPSILAYYSRLSRKFTGGGGSGRLGGKANSSATSTPQRAVSFHSPMHSSSDSSVGGGRRGSSLVNSVQGSVTSSAVTKKHRRHLLFSIREVNFSSLFSSLLAGVSTTDHTLGDPHQSQPLLQIDVYVIRTNGGGSSSSFSDSSSSSSSSPAYEVLTEKFVYRVRASGQPLVLHGKSSSSCSSSSSSSQSRALFLDSSITSNQQYDNSSHCYLVLQVWRYGRMLLSEGRGKNNSVFHTISGSSLASSAVAAAAASAASASTTSLSSLTSFVSASTTSFFGGDRTNTMSTTTTSSSTTDSSSIDSSAELHGSNGVGGGSFKRAVGFAVVPLLELVSRDQELKATVVSRVLLADEPMLLAVPIRLYEGDLTASALETVLKHRQQTPSTTAVNASSSSVLLSSNASSSATISKLSQVPLCQLPAGGLCQVCQRAGGHQQWWWAVLSATERSRPKISNAGLDTISSTSSSTSASSTSSSASQQSSLADWLLLSQCSKVEGSGGSAQSSAFTTSSTKPSLNFAVIQKRFFGDLITAGYFRNDLYLTLEGAEFEKGGKAIPKNIEVAICLITERGVQERALSAGANDEPVTFYRSAIQYHQNSPRWAEHVKVNVPLELFESAHLRFTFAHCSSKRERERKLVGFSFLPLVDAQANGACLPDGERELLIYRVDSERKLDEPGGRSSKEVFHLRTNLVSSKLTQNADILSLLKWSCTPLEVVYESLARLGRVPGEEIVKFLEDVMDALFTLFTNSADLADSPPRWPRFLLLLLLLTTPNDHHLSRAGGRLQDAFRPKSYIETQFSAPLVHAGLLACLRRYIELVIVSFATDASGTPPSLSGVTKREMEFILRCLSVFDWLLKIVVQSRLLYAQAVANGGLEVGCGGSGGQATSSTSPQASEEHFRLELFSLFAAINRLLAVESKSSDEYLIIAIQEAVLGTMPSAFGYLLKILPPLELAKLVQSINSNGGGGGGKKTIVGAKLLLLQETIRCKAVWADCEEARLELLDTFIRLLNLNIAESRVVLAILQDVVLYLLDHSPGAGCRVRRFDIELEGGGDGQQQNSAGKHTCEREIEMLSFGATDAIVEHILELTGVVSTSSTLPPPSASKSADVENVLSTDYLGSYLLCLLVLLDRMSAAHYERLFETRSARQCKELLAHLFMVFLNALYYYADGWLEVKMAVNRVLLQAMTSLNTSSSSSFDLALWRTYFKLAVAFITQQRLQMEVIGGGGDSNNGSSSLPFWKRRLLVDTYGGDLRLLMGAELVAAWRSLGVEERAAFISPPTQESSLRQMTLPLLYDLLAVDWEVNGDFKQVEAALIEKLDALAHKAEADLAYREMFTKILTEQIETKKPIWRLEGLELVASLSRLLRLLVDYRQELRCRAITTTTTTTTTSSSLQSRPEKITEVDDSLLMCTYTLLRFFQDDALNSSSFSSLNSNRRSIMLRYVDRLASLHKLQGNYTEAAFTLKLHADQLSWSNGSACSRKEALSETILEYFERGQCWEEGLAVCKQLAAVYEANYAYAKLAAVLKRNAHFLERILSVGNNNTASPGSSQQPAQHSRTDSEYFRVSFYGLGFASFLQNSTFIYRGAAREFPAAQLLTKSGSFPTDESITESYSQYIQIFAVKPVAEPPVTADQHSTLLFGAPEPPILDYYASNSVRQFLQDRPVQRAPFDPLNEFKSLWIERTVYATERPLPGVMRMFAVVATSVHYLAPVENACETIENMNVELGRLIARFSSEATRPESVSPLSMRLQGILEAAVNGGIAKYIDAFLGAEYLGANPDQVGNVTLLRNRIAAQIKLVEGGLTLHGRLAPTASGSGGQLLRGQVVDNCSDPETSSISSSSSHNHSECSSASASRGGGGGGGGHQVPQQPPPPPPPFSSSSQNHFGFPVLASYLSPNSKTLKKKPLPPLPPPSEDDDLRWRMDILKSGTSAHQSATASSATPHLDARHLEALEEEVETESTAPVPFLALTTTAEELLGISVSSQVSNGGSQSMISHHHHLHHQNHPLHLPPLQRGLSNTNLSELPLEDGKGGGGGGVGVDLVDGVDLSALPPPPLPPRSAAGSLDRSNSLNSGVILRSSPVIPPLIPPALPQRRAAAPSSAGLVRKSSSTSATSSYGAGSSAVTVISNHSANSASSSVFSSPPKSNGHHAHHHHYHQAHSANLDGIEFENLVISSPTPRSECGSGTSGSHDRSSRPAPIIGIEIGSAGCSDIEADLFPATPMITTTSSSSSADYSIGSMSIAASRKSKSSSLPRSLLPPSASQSQFVQQFGGPGSPRRITSSSSSTVLEKFESKIVSKMAFTAVAVVNAASASSTSNGVSISSSSSSTTTTTTKTFFETNSSLLD